MKPAGDIVPGLAHRLRWARERAGWTVDKLAVRACTPTGLLARAEREEEVLGPLSLRLICEALRVSADWLLGMEPTAPDPWPDIKAGVRVRSCGGRWTGVVLATARTTYTWVKVKRDDGTVHRVTARHLEAIPCP